MEEEKTGVMQYYTYYYPKKVKHWMKKIDILLIVLYLIAIAVYVVEVEPYHWDNRCLVARCSVAVPVTDNGWYSN